MSMSPETYVRLENEWLEMRRGFKASPMSEEIALRTRETLRTFDMSRIRKPEEGRSVVDDVPSGTSAGSP